MTFDLRYRGRWFVVALLLVCAAVVGVRPSFPLPTYAARTGLECRSCHFDPNGGGPRNGLGYMFARQRHDLTPDPDTVWAQIPASNRVGDAVFLGTNTRMIYLYSQLKGANRTNVSSFFQMQGALDVTLQPHPYLTIVMVRDFGEFSGDQTRDLYGMIQDGSGSFYAKAGRIRGVFGLRQDDHTSATRAGFLEATSGGTGGFLPFDPRAAEAGIEAGIFRGPLGLSAALTNSGAAFANKVQAVSAKLTSAVPLGRVGLSLYDSFESSTGKRYTRWAGYGLLHAPALTDLTLAGEVGFGTDDLGGGSKRNLVASFAQAEYRLDRAVLLRAKYDYANVFRSADGFAAERFTVESDLTLVPFADLKLSFRPIVPESSADEYQFLGMVHLYY
jgi:hypothetical protein